MNRSDVSVVELQVQVDKGITCNHFSELPVSLVFFSLICVDIIERIRPRRLMGKCKDRTCQELELFACALEAVCTNFFL